MMTERCVHSDEPNGDPKKCKLQNIHCGYPDCLADADEKPRFNDRIIKNGFPDGWFIQDRICQNTALLCRRAEFSFPSHTCICVRPRAMTTGSWVPIAQIIAFGFEAESKRRIAEDALAGKE